MATADGPGMVYLNGLVGHTGVISCHLYCPIMGQRKENGHYYPVLLKPDNYNIEFCDHADVDLTWLKRLDYQENLNVLLAVCNKSEYQRVHLVTGISKPSIFSGLSHILNVPGCFPGDIMHLLCISIPDFCYRTGIFGPFLNDFHFCYRCIQLHFTFISHFENENLFDSFDD